MYVRPSVSPIGTTVSFVMYVFPSVRQSDWHNSAPTGRIFMKFYIWVFFEKYLEKMQVLLKSNEKKGYFTWRPIGHICLKTSRSVLLRMRNVSDVVVVEVKKFVLRSMTFSKIVPCRDNISLHPSIFLWLFPSFHFPSGVDCRIVLANLQCVRKVAGHLG
jgi:hypothetical protein